MKFQLIFLFMLFASCTEDRFRLDNNEVLIEQLHERASINQKNLSQKMELDYRMQFNVSAPEEYGYIVYKTISKLSNSIVYAENPKNDLMHYKIISKGILGELNNSETRSQYKELEIHYSYRIDEFGMDDESAYTSKKIESHIMNINKPIRLDMLSNNGVDSRLLQEVAVLVYRIPMTPFEEGADYNTYIKQHNSNVLNHVFDTENLFSSNEYLMYLLGSSKNKKLPYEAFMKL